MELVKGLPKYMTQGSAKGCSIEGCPGAHTAKGYCGMHYARIIRFKREGEKPGDGNPWRDQPLTEDEFVRVREYIGQGFTLEDIAWEVERRIGVITRASEYESYAQYVTKKQFCYDDEEDFVFALSELEKNP